MFKSGRQLPHQQWTQPAGFMRRFGAILYDFLLIVAMWIVVGLMRLPFVDADAMTDRAGPGFQSVLFLLTFSFFTFFWLRTGQTLGMQAWRIRIQNVDGRSIGPMQALMRFLAGGFSLLCGGLGHLWMLFSKQKTTWPDQFSDSVVVFVPSDKQIAQMEAEGLTASPTSVQPHDSAKAKKKK